MKYSHYCKKCGQTFFSNDKAEITLMRKSHRLRIKTGALDFRVCTGLAHVNDGSVARVGLVAEIESGQR